jgi:hypothetical protein
MIAGLPESPDLYQQAAKSDGWPLSDEVITIRGVDYIQTTRAPQTFVYIHPFQVGQMLKWGDNCMTDIYIHKQLKDGVTETQIIRKKEEEKTT